MNKPTLAVANVGDLDSSLILQVTSDKVQLLEFDAVLEIFHLSGQWSPESGKQITLASISPTQVLLALDGGTVVLLGLDKSRNMTVLS